jgi:hypothetical protein
MATSNRPGHAADLPYSRHSPASRPANPVARTLLIAALFLALLCLPLPLWSEEAAKTTEPGSLLSLPEKLWEFVRTYQALFGGTLGAALGYLGKWLFDQWSAERTARREFAQTVTTQISKLAKDYYWSLANYAGVLAGLLESYLDNRTHHLMLLWEDRRDLENRLEQIAKTFAEASFYHFCRLIGLFDSFQFQGSNTYLLTNHAAGETSKRLYNTFIASLPTDDSEEGINTLKIVKVLREERDTPLSSKPMKVADYPSELFMNTVAKDDLGDELKNYGKWIRSQIPEVEEAAAALRAYNELLNHELARLYRDFFKKTAPDNKLYLGEVAFDDWPNLLTEQSYAAIERANIQSALLRPLGAPISTREPPVSEQTAESEISVAAGRSLPSDGEPDTPVGDAELGRIVRLLFARKREIGGGQQDDVPPKPDDNGSGNA